MKFDQDIIERFKAVCRDEFDAELTDLEAEQRLLEVVDLFSLLLVERPTSASDEVNDFDSPPPGQVS